MLINVDTLVEEAADTVYNTGHDIRGVIIENVDSSDAEEGRIDRFRSDGCKCQLSGGEPCHTLFTARVTRSGKRYISVQKFVLPGPVVGLDKLCFYFGPLCFILTLDILIYYTFVVIYNTHYAFSHNDYAFLPTIILLTLLIIFNAVKKS